MVSESISMHVPQRSETMVKGKRRSSGGKQTDSGTRYFVIIIIPCK